MTQWVKVLAAMHADLCSSPGTHKVGELSSDLHLGTMAHGFTHTHSQLRNKNVKQKQGCMLWCECYQQK